MATRNGSAQWQGDLKGGNGTLKIGDGVWEGNYSFSSRFEEGEGTNPEELIAAAHAACFSMAFSNMLASEGNTPESIATTASVYLRNVDGAQTLDRIELKTVGRVPGIDEQQFQATAEQAKLNCPVSRALGGVNEIVVDATLES